MTVMISGEKLHVGGRLCYTNPDSQGVIIRHTEKWPVKYDKNARLGKMLTMSGINHYCWDFEHRPDTKHERTLPVRVPEGLEVGSDYVDHMYFPQGPWKKFVSTLAGYDTGKQMGLNDLFESCFEEVLLKAISEFFDVEAVAARIVYYYNVSSGYDCQRIDFLHKGYKSE